MLNKRSLNAVNTQSGNAAMIVLAVVVVVAVGAIAYFTGILTPSGDTSDTAVVAEAPADPDSSSSTDDAEMSDAVDTVDPAAADEAVSAEETAEPIVIKEGNPTVAKVGDTEIKRTDVLAFIQNLSPQMKQMPLDQLFPLAQEQTVNAAVIEKKMQGADLKNDPLVKQELEAARAQIERSVFMQKEADKALTDEILAGAYEDYKNNFPEVEEIKARHILVNEESQAKDILKQLKDGGDFAALAQEYSIDATKENGGELNYFAKTDVVPEFGDAAFSMDVGEISKKPVKSDFGYHIIEVMDKRQRQPIPYEDAQPLLKAQLRGQAVNMVVQQWRRDADVEIYDINGEPVAQAPAPETAPATEESPAAEPNTGE